MEELEQCGGKIYYCCPPGLGVDEEEREESPPGGRSAGQGFVEDTSAEGKGDFAKETHREQKCPSG